MRKFLWVIPVLFAAISTPIARADSFSFTVSEVGGGPVGGSGTFTTDALSGGTYQVTGIMGTFDGSAIVGMASDDFYGADDALYDGAFLPDDNGIAFVTANGEEWNLYDFTQSQEANPSLTPEESDTFAVTDTSQLNAWMNGETNLAGLYTTVSLDPVRTPEPSSIALMLLGIGSLVVMRKRVALGFQQAA